MSGYIVTKASRLDLPEDLSVRIHQDAVSAVENGLSAKDNPYSKGCPAYLQWAASYRFAAKKRNFNSLKQN
jgi:hypothetical protein